MRATWRTAVAAVLCAMALPALADGDCRKPAEPPPAASQPPRTTRVSPALPAPPVQVQCGDLTATQSITLAAPAPAAAGSAASAASPAAASKQLTISRADAQQLVTSGQWAAAAFAGAFALLLLGALVQAARQGGVGFDSHWGGFGGTANGWRLGGAGLTLIAAALCAVVALALWMQLLQRVAVEPDEADKTPGTAAAAAAKPGR